MGPRAELGNEVTTESDFCTTLLNFTDELLIPPTVTTHPADMTLMPFVACGNGAALFTPSIRRALLRAGPSSP